MLHETERLSRLVRVVLNRQRVAVLATQSSQQPYCNLVAFTPADDLRYLFFATPRATHKYSNLIINPGVALLCDTRSDSASDLYKAVAITALGRAAEAGQTFLADYRIRHSKRHPPLSSFLQTPDCIFFQIFVELYIIVEGVSEVSVLKANQLLGKR